MQEKTTVTQQVLFGLKKQTLEISLVKIWISGFCWGKQQANSISGNTSPEA